MTVVVVCDAAVVAVAAVIVKRADVFDLETALVVIICLNVIAFLLWHLNNIKGM